LIADGYEINQWSYGWKTIAQYKARSEFVIALVERPADLVKDCVSLFGSFFEQTVEMVMATNAKLKGVKRAV
jgi:hypothetical protein